MRDDYYYSGQYAEEQAEAKSQAVESVHRTGPWHVSEHTDQAWADDLEKAIALAMVPNAWPKPPAASCRSA